MAGFEFEKLDLEGAYLIHTFTAGDARGGFTKSFEMDIYKNAGIDFHLNETFVSLSAKNVMRGLHFQTKNPQAKLVTVAHGSVFDVLVDLREGSPTFGKWRGFYLNSDNHDALYIPRGFAHGFVSMEDGTLMMYQCDGVYDKETDTGIIYNDPQIAIEWPVEDAETCIHSARDMSFLTLDEMIKSKGKIFD